MSTDGGTPLLAGSMRRTFGFAAPRWRVFEALTDEIDGWWCHRSEPESTIVFDGGLGGQLLESRGPPACRWFNVQNASVRDPEELVLALWMRWSRDFQSLSAVTVARTHGSVMVEGDRGSYGGENLLDALEHRLQGEAPQFSAGWGADAH